MDQSGPLLKQIGDPHVKLDEKDGGTMQLAFILSPLGRVSLRTGQAVHNGHVLHRHVFSSVVTGIKVL